MSNNKTITILAVVGLILGLLAGYSYYSPKIINYQNEVSTLENDIMDYDNEIADLQFEINSLGDNLTHAHSSIEDLVFEVEQINSKYESVLNQYMDIISSYQSPYNNVNQYYDDFTEYGKTDPGNSLIVSTSRVSWMNMDRSTGRNIWREYDADFSSDFVHKFTFSIVQIEAGDKDPREIVRLWTLKGGDVSLIFYAVQANSVDDVYNVVFFQKDQHDNWFVYYSSDDNEALSVGEVYYATITKRDDVYRLFIFNEFNTLIDSGSQLGVSVDYTSLSIVSVGGYSDDLDDWSSGYVGNLRIFN